MGEPGRRRSLTNSMLRTAMKDGHSFLIIGITSLLDFHSACRPEATEPPAPQFAPGPTATPAPGPTSRPAALLLATGEERLLAGDGYHDSASSISGELLVWSSLLPERPRH